MALTYPLSLQTFWDWLPVESAPPRLVPQQELSGTGSGRIAAAEIASPLWRANVSLGFLTREEEGRASALIDALDGAQNTFLFTPKARPFPIEDPTGAVLGGASPEIASIGANNKSITISNLPADYQLRAGDFLSFVISGRNHLHRFSEDVISNGAGVTPFVELRPHLRPGTIVGLGITLAQPVCDMLIEPETYDSGQMRGRVRIGVAFNAIQKF